MRGFAARLVLLTVVAGATPWAMAGEPRLSFDTPQTLVPIHETRVIPFRLAEPAEEDRTWTVEVDNASLVRIVRPAAVLKGQTIGYMRVEGVTPGIATLTVGNRTLRLEIADRSSPFHQMQARPEIISPVNGAVVWGGVGVGVEWFDDPLNPLTDCRVTINGGKALTPESISTPAEGPTRRASFTLPADASSQGTVELVATLSDRNGKTVSSRTTRIRVIDPSETALKVYEAEDWATAPRPERFGRGRINVQKSPECSGGSFVNNAGADPAVGVIFEVPSPGDYQVMIVGAGDVGGTALPTVGVIIDGANQATTHGRLTTTGWHRIAVGSPVRIEAGWRTVTTRFENDFAARGTDRNLRIDRIEIVRIEDEGQPARPGGDAMSGMMAGDSMMAAQPSGGSPRPMQATMTDMATMNAMASGGAGVQTDDPDGRGYSPLRIAWAQPYHGLRAAGLLQLDGVLSWNNRERAQPALVALVLNGKVFSTQTTTAPRFWVSPADLRAGDNTLQLIARGPGGVMATAPAQTIRWEGPTPTPLGQDASFRRFALYDPAWPQDFRDSARPNNESREARRAGLGVGETVALTLPPELTGRFRVWVENRCTHDPAKSRISFELKTGDETPAKVGSRPSQGWWDVGDAGAIDLPPGPKQLLVAYANESLKNAKPDNKGLWIESVILHAATARDDAAPPRVEILYPGLAAGPPPQIFETDAVVFNADDDQAVVRIETLIDGKPTGVAYDVNRQPGPYTLPILLRGVAPGAHELSVRITDASGKTVDAPARAVTVTDQPPRQPGQYARAVRLLNRFAFGPEPRELCAILTMGEQSWLSDRLARTDDDGGDAAAFGLALARYNNPRGENEVCQRAILQGLATSNPARMRFVLWAENHFSTWIRKPEADRKWGEHVAFWRVGVAPFRDLLLTSATSPAMLYFLDQTRSFAGRLNENYAREIMELHTLGVKGGYTQEDVTNLAKLLTGWTAMTLGDGFAASEREVRRMDWRFDPILNDPKPITVLGVAYPEAKPDERYDRIIAALETLVSHPSTARQVCLELCEAYVSKPAPDDLVDDLAEVYTRTYGDMNSVLQAMAQHPAFWRETAKPRLAHPLEWALRTSRPGADPASMAGPINGFLRRARAGLFDCSTPDGYTDADSAWIDSNAMLQRWKLTREAQYCIAGVIPPAWRWSGSPPEGWAQNLVDLVSVRLTGRVLRPETTAAAVDLLNTTQGTLDERAREVAVFIAQTPDANLR